ncbi:hypothetical protein EIN_430760 [Entamoeba invadens IP1]|uniref:VPS9 domain-containing protein n=1 Tax=Entamoeba invadens IP1 TaxID=370355 RepID=A0A0A1UFA2_ENTIV|nr:hypothetical protein EIN_430760 [Entamoeba invadens IP1]ELP95270.1 hypothetical protein EIN_430760 [Entamoeba invadens IP1]|eukprot:XP_004262041.1 hypothetical protein EIN_430760 [Entamoeba invadens IP1]
MSTTPQTWKKTETPVSGSLSPPVEIDFRSKIPFEQVFEELMVSFAKQFYMPYIPVSKISNTKEINSSPEIHHLLSDKIGLQAVVTCLEHGFTLTLPLMPLTITPEFLLTHMIKKHPSEQHFVTFNGLYGKITDTAIALFADQTPKNPWKTMPDLFHSFPDHFYANLKDPNVLMRREREIQILGESPLQTPFGEMSVIFIDSPLIYNGCSWGWVNDKLLPGFLWIEKPTVTPRLDPPSPHNDKTLPEKVTPKWYLYPTEPIEHSGNLFLQRFNDKRMSGICKHFETLLSQYSNVSATLEIKEKGIFMRNVIDKTLSKIQQHELWKDFPEHAETVTNCLETIFTSSLYEKLWPPSYENNPKEKLPVECRDKDKRLEEMILSRQFIKPQNIGLEFIEHDEDSVVEEVGSIVREVNMKRSPGEKLKIFQCVKDIIETIVFHFIHKNDKEIAVKLLSFVLLKSNVPFLHSNLQYIKEFHVIKNEPVTLTLEFFDAALRYLATLGFDKLNIPKQDYDVLFSRAKKKTLNPIAFSDYYAETPLHYNRKEIIPKLLEMKPEDLSKDDLDVLLKEFKTAMRENRELKKRIDAKKNSEI